MTFGSLFAGIGGIDLGLERAGMECRWQVEIDPYCQKVLEKHWPDVKRYGDITQIGDGELEQVDLIAGGFPCQPVSVAGKRLGQDDDRWLWPEFARVVRMVRPRFVLVENVPGLLVRGMEEVLGDLASLGYDAEWGVLSAADMGAPHLRKRVFIVAHSRSPRRREDPRGPHEDESQYEGWSEAQADEPLGDGEGDRTGDVADADGGGLEGERVEEPPGLEGPRGGFPDGRGHHRELEDAEAMADADRPGRGERRGTEPVRAQHPPPECGSEDVAGPQRQPAERGDHRPERWERSEGETGKDAGARTSPSDEWWAVEPDVGRVAHGVPNRVDRLGALGNAVVPQCAEWIGRRIMWVSRYQLTNRAEIRP